MSDIRKHSDDLLRDKFLSFEGDIPMSDWDIIADRLEKKRRFAWIWWAAIPLILISGLSILTYHFTQKQISKNGNLVNEKEVIVQEKSSTSADQTVIENTISEKEKNAINNPNSVISKYPVTSSSNSNSPKLNDIDAEERTIQDQPKS
jgi:hypothetical protein